MNYAEFTRATLCIYGKLTQVKWGKFHPNMFYPFLPGTFNLRKSQKKDVTLVITVN